MAGSWPRRRGIGRPTRCSISSGGPTGIPTPCVTTCGPRWSSTGAIPGRSRGDPGAIPGRSRGDPGAIPGYVGCVGKVEQAQVGVFLAYASPKGVAFLDRALYLPEEWTDDPARCQRAGIPEGVGFATKPQLAQTLLARARAAGVPAGWVTADRVYGDDRSLRIWRETQEQAYVLAVSGKEYVNVAATWTQRRVSRLLQELQVLPAEAWQRLSVGDGEQGPRLYDWYGLPLIPPLPAMSGGAWCGAA